MLDVSAEHSPARAEIPADVPARIAALTNAEMREMLTRIVLAEDASALRDLRRRFTRPDVQAHANSAGLDVSILFAEGDRLRSQREELDAKRLAAARAEAAAKAAEERARHLADLGRREEMVWREVESNVAAKNRTSYDRAIGLLCDLRDLAVSKTTTKNFAERVAALRKKHAAKVSLLARLKKAEL
jgi:hypothetical protein